MIADISKTTRFTPPAWARWRRLIGLKYTQNWADVVNAALKLFEDTCISDGLLRPYNPHEEQTVPQLFQLVEAEQPARAEQPAFAVFSRQKCERCKKDKLVNNNLLCETCQLIEDSNGQLTTADKLPPTSPATSSEAVHTPRGRRKPKTPQPAQPTRPATRPSTNGKHNGKKPTSKKGAKS